MRGGASTESLRDELIASVLGRLSPFQLVHAELTCKRWHRICQDHSIWRWHYETAAASLNRPLNPGEPGTYKEKYFELLLEAAWGRDNFPEGHFPRVRAWVLAAHPPGEGVTAVAASRQLLATASHEKTVKIWDMEAAGAYPLGPYQEGTPPPASLPPLETLSHPSAPLLLAFLNPHLLLSATPLCAYLWCLADLAPGTPSAPPGGQASRISGAPGAARHSAAQGQAGAQRGAAGTARLVRRIAGVSPGDAGTLRITCGTAWDMQFVAGMSDGSAREYDAYSGALVKLLRPHQAALTALQTVHLSPGRDLLLSAGKDGRVVFSDLDTGLDLGAVDIAPGEAGIHAAAAVAVHPLRGQLLVALPRLGEVRVWSLGRDLGRLPSPLDRISMDGPRQFHGFLVQRFHSLESLAIPSMPMSDTYLAASSSGGLATASFPGGSDNLGVLMQALEFPGSHAPSPGPHLRHQLPTSPSQAAAQGRIRGIGGGGTSGFLPSGTPAIQAGYARPAPGVHSAQPSTMNSLRHFRFGPQGVRGEAWWCERSAEALSGLEDGLAGVGMQPRMSAPGGVEGEGSVPGNRGVKASRSHPGAVSAQQALVKPGHLRRCSCICASQLPIVTGHSSGEVVLWMWEGRCRGSL